MPMDLTNGGTSYRVALVSCVKSKRTMPSPAKDLYTSALFRGFRRYAEANADTWYILSAKYGLLFPDDDIAPYEMTLKTMKTAERLRWADAVRPRLLDVLPVGAEVIFLAGEDYRENLESFLRARGFAVHVPFCGLRQGALLHALKEQGWPS